MRKPEAAFTDCPIDVAVHLLSNKWMIPILRELINNPRRPIELEKALPGISAKTLTERLHELEKHKLVSRQSLKRVPPHVIYTLTDLGARLGSVMQVLKEYGIAWQKELNDGEEATCWNQACSDCPDIKSVSSCPSIPALYDSGTHFPRRKKRSKRQDALSSGI